MKNGEEHYIVRIIKDNLFPIIGLIGGILALWGMTQTLPLESRIKLSEQAIVTNAKEIDKLRDGVDGLPTREEINARFDTLQTEITLLKDQNDHILKLIESKK